MLTAPPPLGFLVRIGALSAAATTPNGKNAGKKNVKKKGCALNAEKTLHRKDIGGALNVALLLGNTMPKCGAKFWLTTEPCVSVAKNPSLLS